VFAPLSKTIRRFIGRKGGHLRGLATGARPPSSPDTVSGVPMGAEPKSAVARQPVASIDCGQLAPLASSSLASSSLASLLVGLELFSANWRRCSSARAAAECCQCGRLSAIGAACPWQRRTAKANNFISAAKWPKKQASEQKVESSEQRAESTSEAKLNV